MFSILQNAAEAGYTIFLFLLIVKSLYLIFYNYFQSKANYRIRLFKSLRLLYYFIIVPILCICIYVFVKQYLRDDYNDFKLSRVYWKVVTVGVILVIFGIILFALHPTVSKALRFLKKNDRNEVKYQLIFKKARSIIIVLIVVDMLMLAFLSKAIN